MNDPMMTALWRVWRMTTVMMTMLVWRFGGVVMSNIKLVLERVERRRHDLATLRVEPGGFDRDQQALAACVRDLAEKGQQLNRALELLRWQKDTEPLYSELAKDGAWKAWQGFAAVLAKWGLREDEE